MIDISILQKNVLFKGLTVNEIKTIIDAGGYSLRQYPKGSTLAVEGEPCDHMGIIIGGVIEVQSTFASGKVIIINHLQPSETYGEAVLFSSTACFPATLYCPAACEIVIIQRSQLRVTLHTNHIIMENFLGLLSDRLLAINRRIKLLSLETLRKRVAAYLLEESKNQKKILSFNTGVSREQMSRLLNVQRPSLSRELSLMQEEGLLRYNKDYFELVDIDALIEIVTESMS